MLPCRIIKSASPLLDTSGIAGTWGHLVNYSSVTSSLLDSPYKSSPLSRNLVLQSPNGLGTIEFEIVIVLEARYDWNRIGLLSMSQIVAVLVHMWPL